MTDIRARLTDALREHASWAVPMRDDAERIADVLLSLPGIAIVELPEPLPGRAGAEMPRWEFGGAVIQSRHPWVHLDGRALDVAETRALATRLLAAANAAEEDAK
jgi:hypothetical protein